MISGAEADRKVPFACSVVIPSRNRAKLLNAVLEALASQDFDRPFEVIVVLDGCTDSSADVAGEWEERGAFGAFRWVEQSRKGPANARNRGAFLARAPVVLLLDDDVVPDTDFISIHMAHHASGERIAVFGDTEIVRTEQMSMATLWLWAWWEDTYARRAAAWQPSSFCDFLSANVSLRREDFARVGGFDPDYTADRGEDYELGYRLLQSGVRFVIDQRAQGRHFNHATIKTLKHAAHEGAKANVIMARKHPELAPGLWLGTPAERHLRLAAGLGMYAPWLGVLLYLAVRAMLPLLERVRLRRRWLKGLSYIQTYAYWRGLRKATGSMKNLRALRDRPFPSSQQIDVSRDLGPQVRKLSMDVPSTIVVMYEGIAVGSIELPAHIEEPLLPWLVRELSARLREELMMEITGRALPTRLPIEEHDSPPLGGSTTAAGDGIDTRAPRAPH